MKVDEDEGMKHFSRAQTPADISQSYHRNFTNNEDSVTRIPSTLSVTSVDFGMTCQPSSLSHSVLTLTPGRIRNIDQDMEALRLSRQDNPFLQVLASRENLIESIEESESDDAILMSQELGDTDPLTLAQVHEHLVRSPPPASWPHTPTFHFPHRAQNEGAKSELSTPYKSPSKILSFHNNSDLSSDIKDLHVPSFSLLHPTPIRSLTEVRRLHNKTTSDDHVQLMSSE